MMLENMLKNKLRYCHPPSNSYIFTQKNDQRNKTMYHFVLLLLLSRFSRFRCCATPETAAHQAAPSLGFSRKEHWSGLPFPYPVHESEK